MRTRTLSVSQALVEFLANQWTVDRIGGQEYRQRTIPGMFGGYGGPSNPLTRFSGESPEAEMATTKVLVAAVKAGVWGYFSKSDDPNEIVAYHVLCQSILEQSSRPVRPSPRRRSPRDRRPNPGLGPRRTTRQEIPRRPHPRRLRADRDVHRDRDSERSRRRQRHRRFPRAGAWLVRIGQ